MASKKIGQPPSSSLFGFKLKFIEKRKEADFNFVRLEHKEDGHNKYYEIKVLPIGNSSLTKFSTESKYGKIGSIGGVKKQGFQTLSKALTSVQKKVAEKLKKGYKRVK